jgi:hypothetical protein
MATEPASSAEREQALDEVLTAYLKAVDAGRPPDRRELLARHAELAPDLERFFADEDAIGRWTVDAARELSIYQGTMPEASSACLAAQLLGKRTAPWKPPFALR